MAEIRTANDWFRVVAPQLRPASPKQMVKLLKTRSIKDFREFIGASAKSGRLISSDDYVALTTEIMRKQNELDSIREIFSWGERVFSLIPGYGLLVSALGLVADKVATRKKTCLLYTSRCV